MGVKGDKMGQESVLSAETLVARLEPIGGITSKKMFGGHGIFHEGKMFGIIDSMGKAFFKVDDDLKAKYENKGGEQHSKMPYFSIPESIWNDPDELIAWAKDAIRISK